MTYTVIKQDNKAWLKEDAVMKEPNEKEYEVKFGSREYFMDEEDRQPLWRDIFRANYLNAKQRYEQHIASLRTIQIADEYVDYWAEGAKVPVWEFTIKERDQQDRYDNGEWARSYTTIQVAIPARDEAGLWFTLFNKRLKFGTVMSKQYSETAIKYFTIKRKQ